MNNIDERKSPPIEDLSALSDRERQQRGMAAVAALLQPLTKWRSEPGGYPAATPVDVGGSTANIPSDTEGDDGGDVPKSGWQSERNPQQPDMSLPSAALIDVPVPDQPPLVPVRSLFPTPSVRQAEPEAVAALAMDAEELDHPSLRLIAVHPHDEDVAALPVDHPDVDRVAELGTSAPLRSSDAAVVEAAVDVDLDALGAGEPAVASPPTEPAPERKEPRKQGLDLLREDLRDLFDLDKSIMGVKKQDLLLKGLLNLAPMVVTRRSRLMQIGTAATIGAVMAPIAYEAAKSSYDGLIKVHQRRMRLEAERQNGGPILSQTEQQAAAATVMETFWNLDSLEKKYLLHKFWIGAKAGLMGVLQNESVIEAAIKERLKKKTAATDDESEESI